MVNCLSGQICALIGLAMSAEERDIALGGWRRTRSSPIGSDPEGSSPNEFRFGSLASLFLQSLFFMFDRPRRLRLAMDRAQGCT